MSQYLENCRAWQKHAADGRASISFGFTNQLIDKVAELENQIINRAQDSREARNRLIGITIVALIEFLWILLRPACGV